MRIIIFGIGGRLGNAVYETAVKNGVEVVCGIDAFADSLSLPVPVFKSLKDCNIKADVLIDFSRPAALNEILEYITATGTPAVLSTTGYSKEQQELVEKAAKQVAVFQSSNMSLGVNLLIDLAQKAAQFLGRTYDVEIIEQHHNRKVDSPSGTALSIASAINSVFDNTLVNTYGRTPESGKRDSHELGIHSVRGGTIVGNHDVLFIGSEEIVTIAHSAQSISVFAIGALRAAEFLLGKAPGKYNMNDLIGRDYSVTTVSGKDKIALVSCNELDIKSMVELFKALSTASINVDMISQVQTSNGYSVTFSTDASDLNKSKAVLGRNCIIRENLAQLVIVGAGMEHQSGVADTVLSVLSDANIEVCAITTGSTQISCALPEDKLQTAITLLRDKFQIKI